MTSANSTATPAKIVPSEVGWQFVPQYYTFVNKQPSRLHCFYTKNSTFIHGTEGEDGKPCYGQHEIHEKILSIGFQDCKVFIHSVDAQSSANNGIIIQVIGEMSNKGEPWRKFAQTFFLAEQPNGYFVLNDIFRFLKEETADDVDDQASDSVGALGDDEIIPEPAPAVEANYHPNPQQQSRADPPPAIEHLLAPIPSAQEPSFSHPVPNGVNGTHTSIEQPSSPEPEPVIPVAEVTQTEPEAPEPATTAPPPPVSPPPTLATPVQTPTPAPEPATPVAAEKPVVEAAAAVAPSPAPAAASPAQPQAPPKPAVPKSWATLAATKSQTWGSALAVDSKGVSAAAASASAPTPAPKANGVRAPTVPNTQSQSEGGGNLHPAAVAANSVTTAQCFVKSVTENVEPNLLRSVLVSRFGPVKELEIVRSKACAFLEFNTVDSARRAILASLPVAQGGEGGIRIGEGDPAALLHNRDVPRITVETRKERADRPVPRPRGGAPNGGDRGGFRSVAHRGRGAPRGAAPNAGTK